MKADIVTHVDPVTVSGEEFESIHQIISKNLLAMNMDTVIQDLRIVKNKNVESILFQVPVFYKGLMKNMQLVAIILI